MGYDLHITRSGDWFESESNPITFDEWLAYVRADAEMRLDGFAEAELPDGGILRVEAEGLSVWESYSGHAVDGNMAWFDWRSGRIVVKNPDQEIIKKMKCIANSINAFVVGDEGEVY